MSSENWVQIAVSSFIKLVFFIIFFHSGAVKAKKEKSSAATGSRHVTFKENTQKAEMYNSITINV